MEPDEVVENFSKLPRVGKIEAKEFADKMNALKSKYDFVIEHSHIDENKNIDIIGVDNISINSECIDESMSSVGEGEELATKLIDMYRSSISEGDIATQIIERVNPKLSLIPNNFDLDPLYLINVSGCLLIAWCIASILFIHLGTYAIEKYD